MSRISETFENLKKQNKKALITFITAGDPNLLCTQKYILDMAQNGSDIIEIGIPFSDPIAEGPVIQRASERALQNNTNLDEIFSMVKNIREITQIPLVMMMYINSIYKYGAKLFFENCKKFGIDGVIVPDLPIEEKAEIEKDANQNNIDTIFLVCPTSKERIKEIAQQTKGFLYCVSSNGVTGVRKDFSTDFELFFSQINQYKKTPTAIGFGISTKEQAKYFSEFADGIIIGSAIVKIIEEEKENASPKIIEFVKDIKSVL